MKLILISLLFPLLFAHSVSRRPALDDADLPKSKVHRVVNAIATEIKDMAPAVISGVIAAGTAALICNAFLS